MPSLLGPLRKFSPFASPEALLGRARTRCGLSDEVVSPLDLAIREKDFRARLGPSPWRMFWRKRVLVTMIVPNSALAHDCTHVVQGVQSLCLGVEQVCPGSLVQMVGTNGRVLEPFRRPKGLRFDPVMFQPQYPSRLESATISAFAATLCKQAELERLRVSVCCVSLFLMAPREMADDQASGAARSLVQALNARSEHMIFGVPVQRVERLDDFLGKLGLGPEGHLLPRAGFESVADRMLVVRQLCRLLENRR